MSEPRGSGGRVAPAALACAVARARDLPPADAAPPVVAPVTPSPPATASAPRDGQHAAGEACDYCGAEALSWRKCKLICANCAQINKSCADL